MKLPKIANLSSDTQSALVKKGMALVQGLLILVVAHLIGSAFRKAVYRWGNSDLQGIRASSTLSEKSEEQQVKRTKLAFVILGNMAYYGIVTLALLLVLKLFGIEAASIIALLGATGFTVGLALQGTLSDISSGILLGLMQTYAIGDLIEIDEHKGHVYDFNLTKTVLMDLDTQTLVIIPNRTIAEKTVINHSKFAHRRVVANIRVRNTYNDFEKLIELLLNELNKHPDVLQKPAPPVVGVSEMGDVGTIVSLKFFIKTSDYPAVVMPILTKIRQLLVKNDVPLVDPF